MSIAALANVVLVTAMPLVFNPQSAAPVDSYSVFVRAYRQQGASIVAPFVAVPHAQMTVAIDAALSHPLPWRELRAAVLLHSEATLHHWSRQAEADGDFHLSAARRVLDRVVELERSQNEFARRWYALMIALARASGPPTSVGQMHTLARNRWPHDEARDRFERGLEAEVRGSVEGRMSVSGGGLPLDPELTQARLYARAAREYSAALARNPGLHAAALHLGRIRLVQGNLAAAEPLLRQALASADPRTAYLASLFLGSIEERRGRFVEAESCYRDALQHYPEGQSAPLALAQLLSRTGREAGATAIVGRHLTPGRDPVVEPLWTYLARPYEALAGKFDELRTEAWR